MVQILERLGHKVEYPEELTCCGQPAFNSGYWNEARAVAARVLDRFKDAEAVVIASGSCGAMLKVFYPELFAKTAHRHGNGAVGEVLRVLRFSCHETRRHGGRRAFSASRDVSRRLPRLARAWKEEAAARVARQGAGLELVEMKEAETCCGFGGTFAAKFPMISTAMGEVKCASAFETGAEYIVSNDSSCLMQIQGLPDRQGSRCGRSISPKCCRSMTRPVRTVQARGRARHARSAPSLAHSDRARQIRGPARPAEGALPRLAGGAPARGRNQVGRDQSSRHASRRVRPQA